MSLAAFLYPEVKVGFLQDLTALDEDVVLLRSAEEASILRRSGRSFSVAMLPVEYDNGDFWIIWGEIALLDPRPEILFYGRYASFQIWSGLLEMGGRDMLIEPISAEDLYRAVQEAKKAFEDRAASGRTESSPTDEIDER